MQRIFIPGSPWLYFKVYTGYKTADDLLIKVLRPYVEKISTVGAIDGFFFIRYTDPGFHIRLRLHIVESKFYNEIFYHFHEYFQPCIEKGQITKVLCDTYDREVERYGEKTIELLEQLFKVDSEAIIELLTLLSILPVNTREQTRWQLSLLLLDDAFAGFGYELEEKKRLCHRMAEAFKREFGFVNHTNTKQLNDNYRKLRHEIDDFITTREKLLTFESILKARLIKISEIASQIDRMRSIGSQIPPNDDLICNVQHMTMNRWFRSRNRLHEMVIYDYLTRYYESSFARKKQNK